MGQTFRPFLPARASLHPRASRQAGEAGRERGQSLVEFALIVPLFMVLVMGLIEFSLAFNATLSVNQASQNAALMASEAGNQLDADCLILQSIEMDMQAPTNRRDIIEVQIQWVNNSGSGIKAKNRYTRSGSFSCPLVTGTPITLPYTRVESAYMPNQRCNVINGCPSYSPAHTSVDTVAVQVRYDYTYNTPLGSLMNGIWGTPPTGTGYSFQKRNAFRLEPVL
jgi:Flp pilus assembly protein TadG